MGKIVYCDPDPLFSEPMKRFLEAYGWTVILMTDSSQVLETLGRENPDLLICDWWAEPFNGRKVFEKVRKSEEPRIFNLRCLSAAYEVFDNEEFLWARNHHVEFIVKYKSPEDWHQKIASLIGKEQARL